MQDITYTHNSKLLFTCSESSLMHIVISSIQKKQRQERTRAYLEHKVYKDRQIKDILHNLEREIQ